MPATEAAWLEGDVGEAAVAVLAELRARVGEEAFDPDEGMLVGHAHALDDRSFRKAAAYWLQHADPDGVEQDAQAHRDSRRLHFSQSMEGMWYRDLVLDPINGAVVANALKEIDQELFEADWSEAKNRVAEGVKVADLARTPAQRRADALVELARRAMAVPEGARMPAPLLSVFVGYETMKGRVCELANGTVVSPGSLLPWLEGAYVERAVFAPPDRVSSTSVRARFFTGATRRKVELRDRECYSEFCDQPAAECDIDHIHPHALGGLTEEGNGRPACSFHNRWRQKRSGAEEDGRDGDQDAA